jgi:hypothetical protein
LDGLGAGFSSIDADGSSAALERVMLPSQMGMIEDGPSVTQLRAKYFDFTTTSRGVIANVAGGGLKRDLTNPLDLRLRSYVGIRPTSGAATTTPAYSFLPADAGSVPESDRYWVMPVLTELRIELTFQEPPASGASIPVSWSVEAEIWNPYNVDLLLDEVRINFEQFGSIGVVGGAGGTVDFWRTIGGAAALPYVQLVPPGVPAGNPLILPMGQDHLDPGKLLRLIKSGTAFARSDDGVEIQTNPGFVLNHVPSGLPLTVAVMDGAGATFCRLQPPRAPDVSGARIASVQFRLADVQDDMFGWLRRYDPRGPLIADVITDSPFGSDRRSGLLAAASAPIEASAATPPRLRQGARMSLFDLPRQELVSVGELQHFSAFAAAAVNHPAFGLGHSWGGASGVTVDNSYFDDAFFSGVPLSPDSTWDTSMLLPNTWLEIARDIGNPPTTKAELITMGADPSSDRHTASKFLVRGAFNVNSTSVDAWRSLVLGNSLGTWTYRGNGSDATDDRLTRALFRLPQSAENIGADINTGVPGRTSSWRQGVRQLAATHVEGIASSIASQIQSRATPFRSVAEFVGSGVVQTAIDATTANSATTARLAPGYLSQAEFFTAWAPFIQARSDTFTIRAYGETVNPLLDPTHPDYVASRAWCEATVQRVPTLVEPGDITANATGFGRRFVITSFRWLSPDDI